MRNLIRRGDDHQLRANIETGRADGMLTMEQSLAELVRLGGFRGRRRSHIAIIPKTCAAI